jgi:hypothetical protein
MQPIETPTPVEPTPSAENTPTDRDLQRDSLRELVELSAACAATETQLDENRDTGFAATDRELQKAKAQIQAQQEKEQAAVDQEYQERSAAMQSDYERHLGTLKQGDKALRDRIATDNDNFVHDVKQNLQQAVWLAESLYEAAHNQHIKDVKVAKEQHQLRLQALDEIDAQAIARVQSYGQQLPQLEESAEVQKPDLDAAAQAYLDRTETARGLLEKLNRLQAPSWFIGPRPYLAIFVVVAIAAIVTQFAAGKGDLSKIYWGPVGAAILGSFVLCGLGGMALWFVAKTSVKAAYAPLQHALTSARVAAERQHEAEIQTLDAKHQRAFKKKELEVHAAREKASPQLAKVNRNREAATQTAQSDYQHRLGKIENEREATQAEIEAWRVEATSNIRNKYAQELAQLQARAEQRARQIESDYRAGCSNLRHRWQDGLARITAPIEKQDGSNGQAVHPWEDPYWKTWTPSKEFPPVVRFGELQVDPKQVTEKVPQRLELPPEFTVPALMTFPRQASLLIQHDRDGRQKAVETLQMVMARLLTSLPAGRVRFTIIDPVGLGQNFAGFMHLADYDEALVGSRIWTDAEQIEQRLANLTEHMETVIQKYLRNEFETIDDYNNQAGELAEPYRFLIIADFPVNFSEESIRRLSSIASTGARCGVYTLVARDRRQPMPAHSHIEDLEAHSINLVQQGDHFVWNDEVFKKFPLTLDPPPSEDALTNILHIVGRGAKDANRVEVNFDTIAPSADELWSLDCTSELRVPIGRLGATRLQSMRLGRGVAQHALIAGKTGSGKSTLLHALVTNLAMWYSPDQVEFYLVDFKKGVEFKTYATHDLPHARAIAVESDREFGLSVLQRLDGELARRGELFRKAGVQDLAAYRQQTKQVMPRTLLIIDEFQEFFSEDDKLAQEAGVLLDRLVRQGRAFGIHVLLGSQTIGGTSGLARSTLGQMAVRIALQTSEADSQMILGDSNSAARLLSRPGEAIYNDQGGLVEANSPFQVAWLPDERRDVYLDRVTEKFKNADGMSSRHEPPIVFEGNAPADVAKNQRMQDMLRVKTWPKQSLTPVAWLGDPVAIKDPTAIVFRRQSGANVLVVGQQDESAMAMMAEMMISLAGQLSPQDVKFYAIDGSAADSPLASTFPMLKKSLPHDITLVEYRAVESTINDIAQDLERRQKSDETHPPAIFLFIYGVQRYRSLRKQEDSFSFSSSDEEQKPKTDKQLMDLLREGPPLGIHVICWADTPATVERTFDRTSMREFDNRVLFQMSAADSSNLIDSPAANKLGFFRALAYSEEQGVMEKLRPYALPSKARVDRVHEALTR